MLTIENLQESSDPSPVLLQLTSIFYKQKINTYENERQKHDNKKMQNIFKQ